MTSTRSDFKALVFSGGGTRGLSYVGCLRYLEESGILPSVQFFAGTSIGAVFCVLVLLGYTADELEDIVIKTDFLSLRKSNLSSIFTKYSIYSNDYIMAFFTDLLLEKGFHYAITLAEFFRITQKFLVLTTTNISVNDHHLCYLNHVTHPNLTLLKAIQMTIAIPFVFPPVSYNSHLFVDGGISDNFPIRAVQKYSSYSSSEMLAFYISDRPSHNRSMESYGYNVYRCTFESNPDDIRNNNVIILKMPEEFASAVQFDMDPETKKILIDHGYQTTLKSLESGLGSSSNLKTHHRKLKTD